jgi:hypothetical protein
MLIDIKEDSEFMVKTAISSVILLVFSIDSSYFSNKLCSRDYLRSSRVK